MRLSKLVISAAACAAIIPGAANAAVRYDFEAFSSYDFGGESIVSGGFSVVLPDFVTISTDIPVSSVDSCSVVTSLQVGSCQDHQLARYPGYDAVSFGIVTDLNPDLLAFYYFADGAFGAAGVYDTVLFGADQAARITVTDLAAPGVPEPSSWALLLAGFGVVGGAVRAKRRAGLRFAA